MSVSRKKLGHIGEFKEGRGYTFDVDGDEIAVFYIQGDFYAVSNICPHQHIPLIAEGVVDGRTVTCPMHGWCFDLESGEAVSAAGSLKKYRTQVENDILYVLTVERQQQTWW